MPAGLRAFSLSAVASGDSGYSRFGPGEAMPLKKQVLDLTAFNPRANLPYSLRLKDFEIAMQDVYDFFYDVNAMLLGKGLHRMDDMLRPAAMSGMISDMLTASMAKHARVLVENEHFDDHPDLIVLSRSQQTNITPRPPTRSPCLCGSSLRAARCCCERICWRGPCAAPPQVSHAHAGSPRAACMSSPRC